MRRCPSAYGGVMQNMGDLPGEDAAVERAFGAVNRKRILREYFSSTEDYVTVDTAWQHIYQLLLWINPTISLAHCYESDKCQPHKAWYARSLSFHAWLSDQLGVAPSDLRERIDQLFRAALPALARVETETRRAAALRHLAPYAGRGMPLPGDDPDLVDIILGTLEEGNLLVQEEYPGFDDELARALAEKVYTHFARENKRKNLLGRGFEDTLAAVIERLPGHERWEVQTRVPLGEIPGFSPPGELLKGVETDLAMWEKVRGGRRVLVSAKWSIRADRERQFDSDFDDYSKASMGEVFDYVLITNEFDAARIDAACRRVRGNRHLFSDVVHVQPAGVLVAYGRDAESGLLPGRGSPPGPGRKARDLRSHLDQGRLVALSQWLERVLR